MDIKLVQNAALKQGTQSAISEKIVRLNNKENGLPMTDAGYVANLFLITLSYAKRITRNPLNMPRRVRRQDLEMSKAEQKRFKEQMLRVQMNRISNEQQKKNFESALILIMWVLHDKFGFGQQRLTKVQRELKVLIDNYNDGLFTAEELVNQLYEETGIEHIKFK